MKSLVAIVLTLLTFNVNAAIITVGSYSIDDFKFASSITFVSGSGIQSPNNGVGYDMNTYVTIDNSDVISVGFDDLIIFNGAGFDFLVFELAGVVENSFMSLNMGGTQVLGSFLGTERGYPGATYQINIFGFELSDFGIASGANWLDEIFFSPNSNNPDIAAIAAVNSYQAGEASTVSAPSHLGTLGAILLLMACLRRNRPL